MKTSPMYTYSFANVVLGLPHFFMLARSRHCKHLYLKQDTKPVTCALHSTLAHILKLPWRKKLYLSFLVNFVLYIPRTHLHLEHESPLGCYHYKQLLALKNHCYTYHRINSVLTPSDSIITWPMHMCSCLESTPERNLNSSYLTA